MSHLPPTTKLYFTLKRYGEELLKLEKVTLEYIQDTLRTIENTGQKPFNPRECLHVLTEQILAILVMEIKYIHIGGSRGRRQGSPQRDPIISFSPMFPLKSARDEGRRPHPQTANPGSATVFMNFNHK